MEVTGRRPLSKMGPDGGKQTQKNFLTHCRRPRRRNAAVTPGGISGRQVEPTRDMKRAKGSKGKKLGRPFLLVFFREGEGGKTTLSTNKGRPGNRGSVKKTPLPEGTRTGGIQPGSIIYQRAPEETKCNEGSTLLAWLLGERPR